MVPSLVAQIRERLQSIEKSPYRDALVLRLQDHAIEQAMAIDKLSADSKKQLPLAGLTFVVKDNIDVDGQSSQVGNPSLPWPKAEGDAWVVQQLKSAGAILLGKSHMNEFAAGLDGRNIHYPRLNNPQFPNRLTGGSSSGSAVAVAADLVDFAIGTDTGGSVRIPGCWNGIWGLRLATDPVHLHGVFPRSPTLDALGVLSQSVECVFKVAKQLSRVNTTPTTTRLGYDPKNLEEMNARSRLRFLDTIKALSSRFEVRAICLTDLLSSTEEITRLLKAEFFTVFTEKFADTQSRTLLGPTVLDELETSEMPATDKNKLRDELLELQVKALKSLSNEVDFIVSPLCLDEAPTWSNTSKRNDRFYTVAMSLLGCPALGIPYAEVADGYQLLSLKGMDLSFESIGMEISRMGRQS